MRRIGIIGIGLLGSAIASRLLHAGYEVAGFDLRPDALKSLAAEGLRQADGLASAAEGAEAVLVVLPTLESVEAVFLGPGGLFASAPPSAVLIQMSTISPELTQRLAAGAAGNGYRFLDAPVSGTSLMVARGDSTVLVGGDEATLALCRDLFSALAGKTEFVGPVGSASLAKLATNLLVALNTAALAEALVLAAKGGIPPARMLELLSGSAAASRMMEIRGPLMVAGSYPPQMKLELFLKDLRLMTEEAERLGVALPLTEAARELFNAAGEDGATLGVGGKDLAVVHAYLEKLAGLKR